MKCIILAAGRGKRLDGAGGELPKALRELDGQPLIGHVLGQLSFIEKKDIVVVIGYKGELLREALSPELKFAVQTEQLGTGHAAACAQAALEEYDGPVLVAAGDMPLVRKRTYMALCEHHIAERAACTILTEISDERPALGRIVREDGRVTGIVEARDATPEQLNINELNAAVYVFDSKLLFEALKKVDRHNAQGEYYLTDVPRILIAEGHKVEAWVMPDPDEGEGVNTPEDLARCGEILKKLEQ